jgi:flavin-binding protein dodecin
MSKTYKMVTVVGTSAESSEDAIRNAVADAGGSLRNLGWFEVKEVRGRISGDSVAEFQVKVEIGLLVETD